MLLVPLLGKADALPHAEEVAFGQGWPGLQKQLRQESVVFLFPGDPAVLRAHCLLGAVFCTEIGGLVFRFLPTGPAPSRLTWDIWRLSPSLLRNSTLWSTFLNLEVGRAGSSVTVTTTCR